MSEYLEYVDSAEVETTDLDTFVKQQGLDYVDFMKLDVEGAELEVLRGAGEALTDSLLGLNVEVWFQADRVGRPLFSDINDHLGALGFVLFDLRELNRWRRRTLAGQSYESWIGSGQLMYGNALYLRDLPAVVSEGTNPNLPGIAFIKLASLAEVFCYQDFALEVLQAGAELGLEGLSDTRLIEDLQNQAPASSGGWRAAVRRTARASVPPKMRRRLMQTLQGLLTE